VKKVEKSIQSKDDWEEIEKFVRATRRSMHKEIPQKNRRRVRNV